jgi:hypothetical protein
MSALVDYEDIYTAIMEKIKIPLTDGVTLGRIKRDINMIYTNEVVNFKPRAWWWLEKNQNINTIAKYSTGTVTVTQDSTTITFSAVVNIDLDGYYLKLEGYPDIIKISAHTSGSATATLESAWMNETASDASYKVWKDYASLDSDMKEVTMVTHDRKSRPLDAQNNTKFAEIRQRMPEFEGFPEIFNTGDFDSSGNRILRWFPAANADRVTLHIKGVQEVTALSADADEPLMPVEDRIVLYYGGLALAWERERNESEANRAWQAFYVKLGQMAGKSGDAPQITEMRTDPDYLVNKRYRRFGRKGVRNFTRN